MNRFLQCNLFNWRRRGVFEAICALISCCCGLHSTLNQCCPDHDSLAFRKVGRANVQLVRCQREAFLGRRITADVAEIVEKDTYSVPQLRILAKDRKRCVGGLGAVIRLVRCRLATFLGHVGGKVLVSERLWELRYGRTPGWMLQVLRPHAVWAAYSMRPMSTSGTQPAKCA